MPPSNLLSRESRRAIETKALAFLQANVGAYIGAAINSPRAVGDITQELIANNFQMFVPAGAISNYTQEFARRAMADLAFHDAERCYYVVDVKTHRLDSSFNMPNLTSVERLARFYQDANNFFILMKIGYTVANQAITFAEVKFVPIEFVKWDCLTLGALGWGQIQIANANTVILDDTYTRKRWMLDLCDRLDLFYPAEILKIQKRVDYFKNIRAFWESQPDP
jgi:hypothetical protein